MTQQPTLFDDLYREKVTPPTPPVRSGEALKREGMQRAAASTESQLGVAREIAFDIQRGALPHADGECRADGLCNADDVAAQFAREEREWIGNAAGCLFNDGNWDAQYGYVKSVRPHAHANPIKQWRWKYA